MQRFHYSWRTFEYAGGCCPCCTHDSFPNICKLLYSLHWRPHYFLNVSSVACLQAEQDYNAERLQRTGRGIRFEIGTVTQAQLEEGINRLLTDSRYTD